MRFLLLFFALVTSSVQAEPVSLSESDPIQYGQLDYSGVPQDWAGDESYPGSSEPSTPLHFHAYSLNVGSLPFIDIEIDSVNDGLIYFQAYEAAYHANDLSINWIGDTGSFYYPYLAPVDTLGFQVIVPADGTLVIVLNEAIPDGGLGIPADLLITGFSCNDFTCDDGFGVGQGVDLSSSLSPYALVIPEPSMPVLLALPIGALAIFSRRRPSERKRVRLKQNPSSDVAEPRSACALRGVAVTSASRPSHRLRRKTKARCD